MKYSYTAFTEDEINTNEVYINPYDIDDLDSVENTSDIFDLSKSIDEVVDEIGKYVDENGRLPFHYILKEFDFREDPFKVNLIHTTYRMSGYVRSGNEDRGTLTISIYDGYKGIISYMVKIDHIYQLYLNFKKYNDNKVYNISEITPETINLYIVPVYIANNIETGYVRISDFFYDISNMNDIKSLKVVFMSFYRALRNFIFIQYILHKELNIKKPKIYNTKYPVVRGSYRPKDKVSDMVRVVTPNLNFQINSTKRNIYANERTGNVITINEYKRHVDGYYRMQWVGSKKDDTWHQEQRFVNSYDRNKYNRRRKD